MREVITNLVLFAALAVVFSSFSGCTGTTANSGNAAGPEPPRVGGSNSGSNSIYPMLAPALYDGEIEMSDGVKSKISDRKGKALVLNIWGIWCGPCRDEMPHLQAMQQQYGDRVEVIGLNVGDHGGNPEPFEAMRKFAEQMKLTYTLVRSTPATTKSFYAVTKQQVVPQTIMVDRDGRMRGVFIGGGPRVFEQMRSTLDKIMTE